MENRYVFTAESFKQYYQNQFKSDFERFFDVKPSPDWGGYISRWSTAKSRVDQFHPSRSVAVRPPVSACKVEDPGFSVEKDWYFAAIFSFIVISQVSLLQRLTKATAATVVKDSGFPLVVEALEYPTVSIPEMLRHEWQDPGSHNYYGIYNEALDVAVPYLLKEFVALLQTKLDVMQNAEVLAEFQKELDEVLTAYTEE